MSDPGAATSTAPKPRNWAVLISGFVLLLTLVAYIGTVRFEFVYDDHAQIVENPLIQRWRHAPQYLLQPVWAHRIDASHAYYRPLFTFWLLLNHSFFKMDPRGWHLALVLLHLVATALAFRLAQRLLADDFAAGVAALVFGLHPVHVESVAWVSAGGDPLLGVFVFASLLAWLRYEETPGKMSVLVSLFCYVLALMAKEPAVALPAIIFALVWMLRKNVRSAVLATLPFVAVTAAYLLLRIYALRGMAHNLGAVPLRVVPFSAPWLLWWYVRKLVWPAQLSPYYSTRYVPAADFNGFWVPLASLAACGALLWLAIRQLSRTRPARGRLPASQIAMLAVLIVFMPLVPALDVLALEPGEIAHDRYLYLSCFGLGLLVAMAIRALPTLGRRVFGQPVLQVAATVALAIAMGAATILQTAYWASDIVLFHRALQVAPHSTSATNNLAAALLNRGYYDEGIRLEQQVVARSQNPWMPYHNIGKAYMEQGRLTEAEAYFGRAVQLNSANPQLMLMLVRVQVARGRLDDAERNLREAIRTWPQAREFHGLLGLVRRQRGDGAGAAAAFRQELAINPDDDRFRDELRALENPAR